MQNDSAVELQELGSSGSGPIDLVSGEVVSDPAINEEKMKESKAHFYSQLSIVLFEQAMTENESFPVDLDRVHSWFTKELSDAQKLVCLHGLLSFMTTSQHQFLFTSVAFDSPFDGHESEWLNQAMDDAAAKAAKEASTNTNRLKQMDLTPGENLFDGLNYSKSKFPSEKDIPTTASPVHSLASENENLSTMPLPYSYFTDHETTTTEPSSLNSSFSSSTGNASPSSSRFSNLMKMPKETGKAPPGFLSPNAIEFRPSEPSCHSDVYMVDFAQWLRLLRLHKYSETLGPVFENDKIALLKMSDEQLKAVGVSALGARRKFLRLFERIREEKQLLT